MITVSYWPNFIALAEQLTWLPLIVASRLFSTAANVHSTRAMREIVLSAAQLFA